MLLYLAFKNIITKKSSFVIILFIAFAVMLLVVTNSVFDSTEHGIQETFISSFTGDLVIRPENNAPLSLFGDETPVTGKLTNMPLLNPYSDIFDLLKENPEIESVIPQLTGRAGVYKGNNKYDAAVFFGVDAEDYCKIMTSIVLKEGKLWEKGEKGIILNEEFAEKRGLKPGDTVQLGIMNGLFSALRSVPLTGVFNYKTPNSVLDKIILINPETLRSLLDISDMSDSTAIQLSENQEFCLENSEIDELFGNASDFETSVSTDEVVYTNEEIEALKNSYSSSSWNFFICKLENPKNTGKVIKSLNKAFKKNGWNVEAVNWRSAAGNTAFYLYLLRLILNIGIIIVLATGFIVVNNTLVINVLDRIREIGTMRAIGASKRYIAAECAAETLIMSLIAGLLGCILGILFSNLVSFMNFTFTNSLLIQLFGGSILETTVKFSNLAGSFSVALLIGLVSWIYPVFNALSVNPVQAIQGVR